MEVKRRSQFQHDQLISSQHTSDDGSTDFPSMHPIGRCHRELYLRFQLFLLPRQAATQSSPTLLLCCHHFTISVVTDVCSAQNPGRGLCCCSPYFSLSMHVEGQGSPGREHTVYNQILPMRRFV